MENFNLLKDKALPITERELSILAVATTELQNMGYDPFHESIIIQVEPRLTWKFFCFVGGRLCIDLFKHK